MLWYAFEPTVPTDINRAVALAQKAKVGPLLPYTIQRVGAINSAESVKTLQALQQSLDKGEHAHENHEVQMIIKKALEPKKTQNQVISTEKLIWNFK